MLDLIIHKFADWHGNEIYILREDLLPLACGGNKVRIALKLLADACHKGADTIIGYGNSRSNLCRVLSMLCAKNGFGCVIVAPADDDGSYVETTNSRLTALSGAKIIRCRKDSSVAEVVAQTLNDIRVSGHHPYYVFGDEFGNGNERILASAYQDVASQIIDWQNDHGVVFNRVALAVGTGSTYAGLQMGFHKRGHPIRLTGFTIAREMSRCKACLAKYASLRCEVSDVALNGGYGIVSATEADFLDEVRRKYAILFDPIYAGKALWGLCHFISNESIRGENILFVHTGSLPLAMDSLRERSCI